MKGGGRSVLVIAKKNHPRTGSTAGINQQISGDCDGAVPMQVCWGPAQRSSENSNKTKKRILSFLMV